MVCCDACGEWFHARCAGINARKARALDAYHCLACCEEDPNKHGQYVHKWSTSPAVDAAGRKLQTTLYKDALAPTAGVTKESKGTKAKKTKKRPKHSVGVFPTDDWPYPSPELPGAKRVRAKDFVLGFTRDFYAKQGVGGPQIEERKKPQPYPIQWEPGSGGREGVTSGGVGNDALFRSVDVDEMPDRLPQGSGHAWGWGVSSSRNGGVGSDSHRPENNDAHPHIPGHFPMMLPIADRFSGRQTMYTTPDLSHCTSRHGEHETGPTAPMLVSAWYGRILGSSEVQSSTLTWADHAGGTSSIPSSIPLVNATRLAAGQEGYKVVPPVTQEIASAGLFPYGSPLASHGGNTEERSIDLLEGSRKGMIPGVIVPTSPHEDGIGGGSHHVSENAGRRPVQSWPVSGSPISASGSPATK
ncbi:unnamed protein product [Discosporangium mesarthrocarpum]